MDDRTFQRRLAVYLWLTHHHSGQGSREYRMLSRFRNTRVSNSAESAIGDGVDPGDEWSEGRERYLQLCASMKTGCDCNNTNNGAN